MRSRSRATSSNCNYVEENRRGDHIWWISDLSRFQAHYPEWKITFDVPRILNEIYAAECRTMERNMRQLGKKNVIGILIDARGLRSERGLHNSRRAREEGRRDFRARRAWRDDRSARLRAEISSEPLRSSGARRPARALGAELAARGEARRPRLWPQSNAQGVRTSRRRRPVRFIFTDRHPRCSLRCSSLWKNDSPASASPAASLRSFAALPPGREIGSRSAHRRVPGLRSRLSGWAAPAGVFRVRVSRCAFDAGRSPSARHFRLSPGRVAQAPRWMQDRGLEWLFRLCVEPRRLWRRYLYLNPAYLFLVALQASGLSQFPTDGQLPIEEVLAG